eukprot:m.129419 g.129419  ORF g.129419 m.129419 type:complete len:53 (-) comp13046_c3_seq1:35-193(-)
MSTFLTAGLSSFFELPKKRNPFFLSLDIFFLCLCYFHSVEKRNIAKQTKTEG